MISESAVVEELQALKGELRWMRTLVTALVLIGAFAAYSISVRLRWIERATDKGKIVIVAPEDYEAVLKAMNRRKGRSDVDKR